jgi:hypothetical protein
VAISRGAQIFRSVRQSGRARRTVRPVMLGWDGTAQTLWNLVMVAFGASALITALRTPRAKFVALGWGKYWVMFWAIALALIFDGYYCRSDRPSGSRTGCLAYIVRRSCTR